MGKHYQEIDGRPYVEEFTAAGKRITTVVIDSAAFERLIDEIMRTNYAHMPPDVTEEAAAKMKWTRGIPAIGRGPQTTWLFERFRITSDIMAITVRGESVTMFERLSKERGDAGGPQE